MIVKCFSVDVTRFLFHPFLSVDLYLMYVTVTELGGYQQVSNFLWFFFVSFFWRVNSENTNY